MQKYLEVETEVALKQLLKANFRLTHRAFQGLDFSGISLSTEHRFSDCLFMGCQLPTGIHAHLEENCLIFPTIPAPFNPFLNKLYTRETLFSGYRLGEPASYAHTLDNLIYQHYLSYGKDDPDMKQALAMKLHDLSIHDAKTDFLASYDARKVVAMMGGHGLSRADASYFEVCLISQRLTENGYLMISGGGPGAMEATHVGAWFAGKPVAELRQAVEMLAQAPLYTHPHWLDRAFEVLSQHPSSEFQSLGIPTWLYGHEPPTPFASQIAKFFDNSIREDNLVTVAKGGIIFAPGSAGTIQEIFQDVTQNHYLSFGYASPMVFLNSAYWTEDRPVYPFLQDMSEQGKLKNLLLSIHDEADGVVSAIESFTKTT